MRRALLRAAPILVGLLVLAWIWGLFGGGGQPAQQPPEAVATGTTKADAYLDRVAERLASPGLSIDPAVLSSGRIRPESFARLDARVRDAAPDLWVYVLPARKLRADDPVPGLPPRENLAYSPSEVVEQLHDRVDVSGVYAVLVDARTTDAGRGFAAQRYGGDAFDVDGAVEHALGCCADDNGRLLAQFTDRVGRPAGGLGDIALRVAGVLAVLAVLAALVAAYLRYRRRRRGQEADLGVLREVLLGEVMEVDERCQAVGERVDETWAFRDRLRRVEAQVDTAFTGATALLDPVQANAVLAALARARDELAGIEALERGEDPPHPGPPCFTDPRHGPATTSIGFTPTGAAEVSVQVCARCAEDGPPAVRKLPYEGTEVPFWTAGDLGRRYVEGYWHEREFPLPEVESARRDRRAATGQVPH